MLFWKILDALEGGAQLKEAGHCLCPFLPFRFLATVMCALLLLHILSAVIAKLCHTEPESTLPISIVPVGTVVVTAQQFHTRRHPPLWSNGLQSGGQHQRENMTETTEY